jgi:hypothetical protein
VVVNASFRSYIIRHDQSGLSRPNHKEKGNKMNIHNVVNSKMTEFNQRDVFLDPIPYGFTWLLMLL